MLLSIALISTFEHSEFMGATFGSSFIAAIPNYLIWVCAAEVKGEQSKSKQPGRSTGSSMESKFLPSHSLTLQAKQVPVVSPLPVVVAHPQNYYSYYSFHVTGQLWEWEQANLACPVSGGRLCLALLQPGQWKDGAERGAGSELWEEDECSLRNIDPTFSKALSLWKSGVNHKFTLAESTGFGWGLVPLLRASRESGGMSVLGSSELLLCTSHFTRAHWICWHFLKYPGVKFWISSTE